MTSGVYLRPSEYSDIPYPITRALIEDGDRHLFGDRLMRSAAQCTSFRDGGRDVP